MQSIGNFYYYVELIIFLFVSGKYSPHRGKNELISTLKKKKNQWERRGRRRRNRRRRRRNRRRRRKRPYFI